MVRRVDLVHRACRRGPGLAAAGARVTDDARADLEALAAERRDDYGHSLARLLEPGAVGGDLAHRRAADDPNVVRVTEQTPSSTAATSKCVETKTIRSLAGWPICAPVAACAPAWRGSSAAL